MARNTRRRAAQRRNQKVLDILNGVAENQDDGDDIRATNIVQHIDSESVDHEHGNGQRQTRRSARLNKRTPRDVTPAPVNNIPEPPDSPLFVVQDPDYNPEAEAENAAEEEADEVDEINEADEADEDEDEDERGVEEDGDSVESEEDTSMSDHEQQLWQEQEQAIANSQQELQLQEQEEALARSPILVVIDKGLERVREAHKEDFPTIKAAEPKTARANANRSGFFGGDDEFADSDSEQEDEYVEGAEPHQEDENDREPASDDRFDMNDSRHDVGTALQNMLNENLFDWDGQRSAEPDEPVQRPRIDDRVEMQTPQTRGPSSRKRRRASNDSTDMPDRTRRRSEPQDQNKSTARRGRPYALPTDLYIATSPEMPDRTRRRRDSTNQNIENAPSRRPPVARGSPQVADWEATMLDERTQGEVIVVGDNITYDDATNVQGLQGTWKRLLEYCQEVKKKEIRRMRRYPGIEAIVERITDLLKDYKRVQRTRSRGRAIDPDTWKRTRQEVNYISEDADKIRNILIRRAKEGKASNDLQTRADAIEYAQVIIQKVMTSLCELALECLKTYYSEEDECLLNGGFGAVLDIVDIVGELDTTLTSLHNCAMLVLSPYSGRPIRQELRNIRGSLKDAEANEQRLGR